MSTQITANNSAAGTEAQTSFQSGQIPASIQHRWGGSSQKSYEQVYSRGGFVVTQASTIVLPLANLTYPSGITRDLATDQRLILFGIQNTGDTNTINFELRTTGGTLIPRSEGSLAPGSKISKESLGAELFGAVIESLVLDALVADTTADFILGTESSL